MYSIGMNTHLQSVNVFFFTMIWKKIYNYFQCFPICEHKKKLINV